MKAVGALGVSDGRLLPAASYEEAYRAREADATPYPHARGDARRRLGRVELIRNGSVVFTVDLRDTLPRRRTVELPVRESENAWYIAKVYGEDTSFFEGDVAFTNPIYFRTPDFREPEPMKSRVVATVSGGSRAWDGSGTVTVTDNNKELRRVPFSGGRFEIDMPITASLRVSAGGMTATKSIYRDHPPVVERIRYIYSGSWVRDYPGIETMHTPVEIFGFDELRRELQTVRFSFDLSRDLPPASA